MRETLLRSSIAETRTPPQLAAGLALVAIWWIIAWGSFGTISDYYFFPLWLGYILTVDGLLLARTGTSPLTRAGWRYPILFLISAPFWWAFEAINEILRNWSYLTPWDYGWLGSGIIGSFSFSTVVPAVLTTAELVASFGRDRWRRAFVINPGNSGLIAIHLLGWAMMIGLLIWPSYLFPLTWISVFLILDPLARFAGRTTVSSYAARGDWRPIFNLAVAGLICGWFWEMWNILSMPKWVYTVPHVDFLRVWEMPILGYGGYIPFAFEIFAYYALLTALIPGFEQRIARITRAGQIDPDDDRYI